MRAGTSCAVAVTTTDTRFANYAFASELGSGIYEISGRTVGAHPMWQIHGIPLPRLGIG